MQCGQNKRVTTDLEMRGAGYSGGPYVITGTSRARGREREFNRDRRQCEDRRKTLLLALKMEEKVTRQGMQGLHILEAGKRQEDSLLSSLGGSRALAAP